MLKDIEDIKAKYPDTRAALLPALHIAQKELGWLSPDAMKAVADALNLPESDVKGTASFYSMFRLAPFGRNLIQLCTNVSCMILGAGRLQDLLLERYGLLPGGTTDDGRFSLVIMECIGACGTAPAMLVNTDLHENITENNIVEILEKYK